MTYEEAKKSILDMCCWCNDDAECIYYEDGKSGKCSECEFHIAIEALEKQIPKKPVMQLHENRVPGEQEEYYCPTCGEWITWDWKWKCCAFCGQKIDWSEEA